MLARLQEQQGNHLPHFYASSGGNAGLACATAARSLNLPCTIVVPISTSPLMAAKIRATGGTVIQIGETWKEADTYLRGELLPQDQGGIYVPPFDHPDIWSGNATVIEEIVTQMREDIDEGALPDVLVCSVGGGGLLNGLVQGIEAIPDWTPSVLAVETNGTDSLSQSLSAKELITLPGITSIATSLGATRVSEQTFLYASQPERRIMSRVMSDEEAARGCVMLADAERLLVEAACGVCVAAVCFEGEPEWAKVAPRGRGKDTKVVIVVCGGSNCTVEMLAEWRKKFGGLEKTAGVDTCGEGKSAAVASGLQTPPVEKV
ncbi:hypothetical protein GP486_008708 [Trichoglossum hirsutum]|uniref:L-serine ammonia-lyase n=1 Tax=Trichoglossum hirsutum TaxID=265104 RepID=A0A9P8I608_9PEZI|nr:hypothetical protein GP486_008708 [Trichoglossum hirsutum]